MDILKVKQNGEWVDIPAIVGPKGDKGDQGVQGIQGPAGADGYSPTATVTKSGDTATISITDKNGTTTAQITDGQPGQPGPGVPAGGTTGQMLVKKSDSDYDGEWQNQPSVPVHDVQVNGVSVLQDGVANVPIASADNVGVVKKNLSYGIDVSASGQMMLIEATDNQLKNGTASSRRAVFTANQHKATFYGLAKSAGDSTQSASSNAVGTYTDAAKIAIQKMLGIYEAPWELIREDTVTNAAEADIEIAVDGNGNAFELTDVYIFVCLLTQENSASVGDSGKIEFYYASNEYQALYCSATSQSAGGSTKGAWAMITNDNGAMIARNCAYSTTGTDRNYVYARNRGDTAVPQAYLIPGNFTYSKVVIKAVTGTAKYKFYGKRKWT